jgi:ABC-type glycerol-3-phosphate transport system substrate-binding protein
MYFLGTYGVPMLEAAGWVLDEDFGAFLFPQENSAFRRTLTGPFDTWSKAAKAPHPEEADRLLAFLAAKDAQTMRAKYHGGMACNKYVTEYDSIGNMIRDAMNNGAVFNQVIGNALPAIGVQLINKGAVPDFYDNTNIAEFVKKCEEAQERYRKEKP